MGVSKAVPTRAGRPRRFEAEDELRLLLDAALAVMERNGYVDAAVADILREADLSTRSFYRHFESKDQLLCALYRREAEAAAVRLQAKVDAAPSPRAALDAWIDEILSFGHHRAKAARVAVFGSPGAMRAEGYAEETRYAAKLLMAPLEALLELGAADGSFPLADPAAADALKALHKEHQRRSAVESHLCAKDAQRWGTRPGQPRAAVPTRSKAADEDVRATRSKAADKSVRPTKILSCTRWCCRSSCTCSSCHSAP